MTSDELFFFNGVNASTGEYVTPPMPAAQLAALAQGEPIAPDQLAELKWRRDRDAAHYGVKEGVDPTDLAQTGWGVIFPEPLDPALHDALRELLEHRKEQANKTKERYREYTYRPNESKNVFLARNGAGPGAVDPDKVPYYLLIVGDPEKIPFAFQYQLDVAYAVGRIHFDTLAEYSQYAQSVVRAEQETGSHAKRAVFFGVANPDDPSTQASTDNLVKPLAAKMVAQTDWSLDTYTAQDANKSRLEGLLRDDPPALLFTASHGAGFDVGDPRQLKHQGALITQDWDGPVAMKGQPIPQRMYYAIDDVPSDAHVQGMITFHFACYGAGTPRYEDFSHLLKGATDRKEIAPSSFLAKLPKRLLAHPKGGALAVIGHVDRAWGSSFLWNKSVEQLSTFESAFTRLMNGYPVGAALEYFNARYAELATTLSTDLENLKYNKKVDPLELATTWTANNDARGYVIIGDPAVRLRIDEPAASLAPSQAFALADSNGGATDLSSIDGTLEKLELQITALGETIRELRAALKK
jgi:hypothetical protein